MVELSQPVVRVHRSHQAAIAEFRAKGRSDHDDQTMLGDDLREYAPGWSTAEGFHAFVQWPHEQALEEATRLTAHVPATTTHGGLTASCTSAGSRSDIS